MMTDDPIRSPLKRRLLVLRLATIGGAASLPGIAAAQGAKSPAPDAPRVPAPPAQQRPGVSDSDPSDPPGQGRGGNRAPQTGLSDSDPSDPPGQGRGGNRAPPQQQQQPAGATDTDPSDAPGRGRGRNGNLKST